MVQARLRWALLQELWDYVGGRKSTHRRQCSDRTLSVAPAFAPPWRAANNAAQGSAPAGATDNEIEVERSFGVLGGPNESIKVGQVELTNSTARG